MPRFRQRIVKVPLGIENPVWADDPEFDVRRHVRHVGVPRPGRLDQLRDLIGRIMSEPLDFQHPLWQLYLIDGLRAAATPTSPRPTTPSWTGSPRWTSG